MNIEDMTIKQCREISAMFGGGNQTASAINNGMIGNYVIVRCQNAGVHTGFLESHNGRECVLTQSRRLWYWKCADKKSFLSGVAVAGLHKNSKVGATVDRIHLTENCEIIQCSGDAAKNIQAAKDYDQQ